MPAILELALTDAAGNDLNDTVAVELLSTETSKHVGINQHVQRSVRITNIPTLANELYRIVVSPHRHRIVQQFIHLKGEQATALQIAIPVDPAKVASISAPRFERLPASARQILEGSSIPRFSGDSGEPLQGGPLFNALDALPLLKACLLNIFAKAAATEIRSANSCLAYFGGLLRLEQDRFFVRTTAALLEETQQSKAFHAVSPALHSPIPGYQILSSYKTFDHYGNLQLTFQRRGTTGNDYVADVDIDDAQGLEHIFQVVRNGVVGPTNPYDIREILLQQVPKIDPGFQFVFAAGSSGR